MADINYTFIIDDAAFHGLIMENSNRPLFEENYGSVLVVGEADNTVIPEDTTSYPDGGITPANVVPVQYAIDSLERRFKVTFSTEQLNLAGGVGKLYFKDQDGTPQFTAVFDPPLDKTDTHELTLTFKITLNEEGVQ